MIPWDKPGSYSSYYELDRLIALRDFELLLTGRGRRSFAWLALEKLQRKPPDLPLDRFYWLALEKWLELVAE